jgi:hypothetical protein
MQWIKSGRVKTYLEIQNDIEKRSKNLIIRFLTFFLFNLHI